MPRPGRRIPRRWVSALAAVVVLTASSPLAGLGVAQASAVQKGYDALVLRPLGLAQVVVGAAGFVLFYGPAAAAGVTGELRDFCLSGPAYQTFGRPLGDMKQHRLSFSPRQTEAADASRIGEISEKPERPSSDE